MRRFLRFSLGGMEGIKGERNEQQSDRAENHHRNGIDLGHFDVEKVRCFIKNALCPHSELWFLCGRGAHFYKKGEKRWPENENWVRKTFNGKFDAYKKLPKTAVFRSVGENYYFLNSTRRK